MKNKENWCESKYVLKNGSWRVSMDPNEVHISSRLLANQVVKFYRSQVPNVVKGDLLDLGCGKVPLYGIYKDFTNSITCVDWPNSFHANTYVDEFVDLNSRLPFSDDSFDTIILSDVLEHLSNPFSLWSEMGRLMRQGGQLILNVPFYYWLHEEPYDFYRYTRYALKSMAENAGFRVLHMESLGGVPEILSDIISKNIVYIPYVGQFCARVLQSFSIWVTNLEIGQSISNFTSDKFPIGYGLVAIAGDD